MMGPCSWPAGSCSHGTQREIVGFFEHKYILFYLMLCAPCFSSGEAIWRSSNTCTWHLIPGIASLMPLVSQAELTRRLTTCWDKLVTWDCRHAPLVLVPLLAASRWLAIPSLWWACRKASWQLMCWSHMDSTMVPHGSPNGLGTQGRDADMKIPELDEGTRNLWKALQICDRNHDFI